MFFPSIYSLFLYISFSHGQPTHDPIWFPTYFIAILFHYRQETYNLYTWLVAYSIIIFHTCILCNYTLPHNLNQFLLFPYYSAVGVEFPRWFISIFFHNFSLHPFHVKITNLLQNTHFSNILQEYWNQNLGFSYFSI